jgi:superfamily I DNA/RNA helicase/Zn-dependent peptidase ImmA (M78 family)
LSRDLLRESARAWRERELGASRSELVAAAEIVARCARASGYRIAPLPEGDPLLAGALAVLDNDARSIWICSSLDEAHRNAILAHEFAHFAIHSDCSPPDFAGVTDLDRGADGAIETVEGYSPRQKREIDANIWAAELLMPEPLVRRLFRDEGAGAPRIAELLGLDASLVRAQMASVLLRAPAFESENPSVPPVAQRFEPALDPSQRAAATVERGPYLLTAGPGTGKTRTLVARCVHLARDLGVAPESILALTFSRKAAAEMRERLIAAGVGSAAVGPWVGTFHAFCVEILRRHARAAGLGANWRLAGESECRSLLERVLLTLRLRELTAISNPGLHARDILKSISRAKDELCGPDRFEQLASAHAANCVGGPQGAEALKLLDVARAYAAYEQSMRSANLIDYGDLIVKSVELLQSHPAVARGLQAQFKHVLADEYQDVNHASARLLRLLAGNQARGLWAVGDRSQSIYRFRGASPANVALFSRDYPDGRTGALDINYRTRPKIVRLFESAAERLARADAELFYGWKCARGDDKSADVKMATATDADSEAAGMAGEMRRLRGVGVTYSDQAVLCRTHAQAAQLAGKLAVLGVPVLYVGDLIDRPEIKDLLCLIDLFAPRGSGGASLLTRIGRLCGKLRDERALIAWAKELPDEGLCLADRILKDETARAGEPELCALLECVGAERTAEAIVSRFLFDAPAFLSAVESDSNPVSAAVTRLSLRRILEVLADHGRLHAREYEMPLPDGETAIDEISYVMREIRRGCATGERLTASAEDDGEIDAVRVMTIHAAKGLEFPAVFIPNLADGRFPSRETKPYIVEPRGMTGDRLIGDADRDEESCLFFVALSRARDHLVMSRAQTYSVSGRPQHPSPLLQLIADAMRRLGIPEEAWSAGSRAKEQAKPMGLVPAPIAASDAKPRYSASALDAHRRCPRRYFYEYELGLAGARNRDDYDAYRECVRSVTAWMQDEWRAGALPDEESVGRRVEEIWSEKGAATDASVEFYRDASRDVLLLTRELYAARFGKETPAPDRILAAELCNCVVNVSADLITVGADGVVRVVEQHNADPGKNDHLSPRLSLLRGAMAAAFGSRPGRIELGYARSGAVKEARSNGRFEPGRLMKYEQAAEGIRRGLFDPDPADSRQCKSCSFYFVCPGPSAAAENEMSDEDE